MINEKPELLNQQIFSHLGAHKTQSIKWLSPMQEDYYAEYSDGDCLNLLGIALDKRPLETFWPSRGLQWDGLGKVIWETCFL
jgi:hypothetical protein